MVKDLKRLMAFGLLASAFATAGGCSSVATLQDWHFSYCNHQRAKAAWKESFSAKGSGRCSDFKAGFRQGYYDTAMGKDCRLPPVAPPKYWSAKYQGCHGQLAIDRWFEGYRCGIAHAQAGGCSDSAEVPVSPEAPVLNKTSCGTCYSPNLCGSHSGPTPSAMDGRVSALSGCHCANLLESELPGGRTKVEPPLDGSDNQRVIRAGYSDAEGMIGGYGMDH